MVRNVSFTALGLAAAGAVAGIVLGAMWLRESDDERALASARSRGSVWCEFSITVREAHLCRGENSGVTGEIVPSSGVEHRTDGFGIVATMAREDGLTPVYVVARQDCEILDADLNVLTGVPVVVEGRVRWEAPPVVVEVCERDDVRAFP